MKIDEINNIVGKITENVQVPHSNKVNVPTGSESNGFDINSTNAIVESILDKPFSQSSQNINESVERHGIKDTARRLGFTVDGPTPGDHYIVLEGKTQVAVVPSKRALKEWIEAFKEGWALAESNKTVANLIKEVGKKNLTLTESSCHMIAQKKLGMKRMRLIAESKKGSTSQTLTEGVESKNKSNPLSLEEMKKNISKSKNKIVESIKVIQNKMKSNPSAYSDPMADSDAPMFESSFNLAPNGAIRIAKGELKESKESGVLSAPLKIEESTDANQVADEVVKTLSESYEKEYGSPASKESLVESARAALESKEEQQTLEAKREFLKNFFQMESKQIELGIKPQLVESKTKEDHASSLVENFSKMLAAESKKLPMLAKQYESIARYNLAGIHSSQGDNKLLSLNESVSFKKAKKLVEGRSHSIKKKSLTEDSDKISDERQDELKDLVSDIESKVSEYVSAQSDEEIADEYLHAAFDGLNGTENINDSDIRKIADEFIEKGVPEEEVFKAIKEVHKPLFGTMQIPDGGVVGFPVTQYTVPVEPDLLAKYDNLEYEEWDFVKAELEQPIEDGYISVETDDYWWVVVDAEELEKALKAKTEKTESSPDEAKTHASSEMLAKAKGALKEMSETYKKMHESGDHKNCEEAMSLVKEMKETCMNSEMKEDSSVFDELIAVFKKAHAFMHKNDDTENSEKMESLIKEMKEHSIPLGDRCPGSKRDLLKEDIEKLDSLYKKLNRMEHGEEFDQTQKKIDSILGESEEDYKGKESENPMLKDGSENLATKKEGIPSDGSGKHVAQSTGSVHKLQEMFSGLYEMGAMAGCGEIESKMYADSDYSASHSKDLKEMKDNMLYDGSKYCAHEDGSGKYVVSSKKSGKALDMASYDSASKAVKAAKYLDEKYKKKVK